MDKVVNLRESDPLGLDAHAPGAKLDAGKVRAGLVLGHFAVAMDQIGQVMQGKPVNRFTQAELDSTLAQGFLLCGKGAESDDALREGTAALLIYLERSLNDGFGVVQAGGLTKLSFFGRCFSIWVGNALLKVSDVGTYGANKYTDNGWIEVPNGLNRYYDAGWRHLLKMGFEADDPDTKIVHVAHAIWNFLAVLELRAKAAK